MDCDGKLGSGFKICSFGPFVVDTPVDDVHVTPHPPVNDSFFLIYLYYILILILILIRILMPYIDLYLCLYLIVS